MVNIWLAGGVYRITEPLSLGIEDSHINLQAIPDEKPIISGGILLSNLYKEANGSFSAQLDVNAPANIRELFVNGNRAIRARHPNQGYLNVKRAGEDKRTHFFFNVMDFPKTSRTEQLELTLLHDW